MACLKARVQNQPRLEQKGNAEFLMLPLSRNIRNTRTARLARLRVYLARSCSVALMIMEGFNNLTGKG